MTIIQILSLFLFFGCVATDTENSSNEINSLNQTLVNDTLSLDDLTIIAGDSTIKNYYLFNSQPYTGLAVKYEMANDGMWSFVNTFKDGIMQRLDVYGRNNYQHRFVEMIDGYEYHTVMFHRNGNRYLESFYDKNKNQIGIWRRWDESGKLEWEKDFD